MYQHIDDYKSNLTFLVISSTELLLLLLHFPCSVTDHAIGVGNQEYDVMMSFITSHNQPPSMECVAIFLTI